MNLHDERSSREAAADRSRGVQPLAGLTGFQRDLLFVTTRLSDSDPNGQRIRSEIAEHYDAEINQGRLYQNLDALVEDGYMRKRPLDGRTNVYRLTDAGLARLKASHRWEAECLLHRAGRDDSTT